MCELEMQKELEALIDAEDAWRNFEMELERELVERERWLWEHGLAASIGGRAPSQLAMQLGAELDRRWHAYYAREARQLDVDDDE